MLPMETRHQQMLAKVLSRAMSPSSVSMQSELSDLKGGKLLSQLTFEDFQVLSAYARRTMQPVRKPAADEPV